MAIPQGIWWVGIAWFAVVAVLWPLQALLRWLAGDLAGADARIGSLRVTDGIEQAGATPAPPREPGA
jgi:hypothetical protein